jgi:hypothetical protein
MMLNILTIDLEDYFQVHAFSNVIRFEDWNNYESRIERNTHRLLEILRESGMAHSAERIANELTPNDSRLTPHVSDLSPEFVNSLPLTSNLKPQTSVRATFFILGWLAERYPHLIRTIKDQGHEIANHGYAHKLIYTQTKEEFRNDIRKSKAILEDITGSEVIGYRAPSYSITQKSRWALEILMEEGFKYDSSIFPIHHDFYGFPQAPRFPFLISMNGNSNFEFTVLNLDSKKTPNSELRTPNLNTYHNILASNEVLLERSGPPTSSNMCASNLKRPAETKPFGEGWSAPLTSSKLIEFPISTLRICGQNLPISGGGYFRLFPYSLIKKGLRRINEEEEQPFIFYIHPWEIDPDQPRINSISRKSRFRHYVNLHKTESKFKKLLTDFRFSSLKNILKFNNIFVRIEEGMV